MPDQQPTIRIRRDQVVPGMIVHSSHGYRLLITEVSDNATSRTDDRHIGFTGHLHAKPTNDLRTERYPASSLVDVEPPQTLPDALAVNICPGCGAGDCTPATCPAYPEHTR